MAAIFLLSILDGLLAFIYNYDMGKGEETVDIENYSLVFAAIVAIPTSLVAIANRPHLFRMTGLVSVITMELYILYQHIHFENTVILRQFLVLTLSLLIACLISLPLNKNVARRN